MSRKKLQMEDISARLSTLVDELADGVPAIFAKKAGINQATFHNYMKGRSPNIDCLFNICNTYDVDLNWLITGKGTPFNNTQSNMASDVNGVNESKPAYGKSTVDDDHSDEVYGGPERRDDLKTSSLLIKTSAILESETPYSIALASNINAFHRAIKAEETLSKYEDRLNFIEKKLGDLEKENKALLEKIQGMENKDGNLKRTA